MNNLREKCKLQFFRLFKLIFVSLLSLKLTFQMIFKNYVKLCELSDKAQKLLGFKDCIKRT